MFEKILSRFPESTHRTMALAVTALSLVLVGVTWWMGARSDEVFVPLSFYISRPQRPLLLITYTIAALLGGLLATRRPRLGYGWLWVWFAFSFIAIEFSRWYTAYHLFVIHHSNAVMDHIAWMSTPAWITTVMLLNLLLLLFPTGKLPSSGWRPVAWVVGILFVLALLGRAFLPGYMRVVFTFNPYAWVPRPWAPAVGAMGDFGVGGLFAIVPLSVGSVLLRLLRAPKGSPERQQVKWFAYAAVVSGVAFGVSPLLPALGVRHYWQDVLNSVAFIALAVAVTVAVLRYRLYDIDVVIRRTLVYAIVTALLAAIYWATVVSLQGLLGQVTGNTTPAAIVVSTLAIAALFNPVRSRVQQWLDQRFFRAKYDAQRVLEEFTNTVRDETDLERITRDIAGVVDATMHPSNVQVWLKEPEERR